MTTDLKPCPFCGYKDIFYSQSEKGCIKAMCSDCGASTDWYNTENEVDEAWNRRAEK
jgi:Lar family restriction alleviation protein